MNIQQPVAAQQVKSPLPALSVRQADGIIVILLILGLLVGGGSVGLLFLQPHNPLVTILLGLLGFFGLFGFLSLLYAAYIEPKFLFTKHIKVPSTLPSDLKIVIVGDFHVGPFKGARYLQRIVQRVNALKPDLILLPGDFLFNHDSPLEPLDPLKDLHAPLGVIGVLGNHDTGHMVSRTGTAAPARDRSGDLCPYLEQRGITMLNNQSVVLTHHGKQCAIAGLDDLWREADLDAAFQKIPSDVPTLLLTHHPDTVLDTRSFRASLVVAGHTHGGQIRLPFIGSIARIPTQLGRKFDRGVFRVAENTHMIITQGAGESGMRLRFWCPPEIVILTMM